MSIVNGTEYEINEYEKLLSHSTTDIGIIHNFANDIRKTAISILLPIHQRYEYIESIGNTTNRRKAIVVFVFVPTNDFVCLFKHQRIHFDIRHIRNFGGNMIKKLDEMLRCGIFNRIRAYENNTT